HPGADDIAQIVVHNITAYYSKTCGYDCPRVRNTGYEKTKSIRAVAARLGMDRRTVRRYLHAPECPQPKPRGKRSSILDPYRDHILARWAEGCHNAAELYREIVRQGYPGSRTIVKDF